METLKKGEVVLGNEDLSQFITRGNHNEETENLLREKRKQLKIFKSYCQSFSCEEMQLNSLKTEIRDLELQCSDTCYPRIDLSFLSHSKEIRQGLTILRVPVFTIHNLYDNIFQVTVRSVHNELLEIAFHHQDYSIRHPIPNFIFDYYLKAFHIYGENIDGGGTRTINVRGLSYITYMLYNNKHIGFRREFNGLIPVPTRKKIEDFKTRVPDNTMVYIISEAEKKDWDISIETVKGPLSSKVTEDPLVVGITPTHDAYLIDHFDTTTFEEYVAREFTS
jgi:hypothetical protein